MMSNLVENNQDLLPDAGKRLLKFSTPGLILQSDLRETVKVLVSWGDTF